MTNNALIVLEIVKDDKGNITGIQPKISASLADIAVAQVYLAEFLSRQSAQVPDTTGEFPAASFLAESINYARNKTSEEPSK